MSVFQLSRVSKYFVVLASKSLQLLILTGVRIPYRINRQGFIGPLGFYLGFL